MLVDASIFAAVGALSLRLVALFAYGCSNRKTFQSPLRLAFCELRQISDIADVQAPEWIQRLLHHRR